MRLKIKLVNMPFAMLEAPSIALTQLKAVIERLFPERVHTEIHYLNHDFGGLLTRELYNFIATSVPGHVSGLGEWLFRQVAFPDVPDNRAEYVRRYGHHLGIKAGSEISGLIGATRERLAQTLDDLIERYRLADANVVGLTSMFFQNLPSIALARRLKLHNPRLIVVMGGANCEGTMGIELVTHLPTLDFVFSGPGLLSFPRFIGLLIEGQYDACHQIDGVFSSRNARSITTLCDDGVEPDCGRVSAAPQLQGVHEQGRELDINASPDLDYDDFIASLKRHFPELASKIHVLFETSRGCWWGERAHCTFCGLNGSTMAYRAMHPEKALRLIRSLVERYGDHAEDIHCVDNIMPKEYIEQVFGQLSVPASTKIFYEVKADLTAQQIETISRGGVKRVQPGIESLATSTLKLMRKGTTAFRNIRFLSDCTRYGVEPLWNVLVGFPGEGAEVYEMYARTLPGLFHLPPPTGVYPVRFDRFSPYFMQQERHGLKLAPYDYYALCYPFPRLALMNMAYYFQDLNTDAPYIRDVSRWISPLQSVVERWKAAWSNGAERPRLDFVGTTAGGYVLDSRRGTRQREFLTGNEVALLREMEAPTLIERLNTEHGEVLQRVGGRSLVFSERGRVMSIVGGL